MSAEKLEKPVQEKLVQDKEVSEKALHSAKDSKKDFQGLVRFLDRDIKGETPIFFALSKVKGAGFMISNAICRLLQIDRSQRIGELPPEEVKKIEEFMRGLDKHKLPKWLLNRRKDRETGDDLHLFSSDLDLTTKFDIQFLKKIKCYRGMRHARGDKKLKVKVRGQRTKSTGRKRGATVGVQKKKEAPKSGGSK